MDIYEANFTLASTAGPLVAFTFVAAAVPAAVLEVAVFVNAVTVAGEVVFGRPATLGTGTAGTALQPLDPSDAAASTHVVSGAFATIQPAAPTVPFRRFTYPAASAGCGVIWGWNENELIIPTGGQLVLWIASGTVLLRGYVKVAEGG